MSTITLAPTAAFDLIMAVTNPNPDRNPNSKSNAAVQILALTVRSFDFISQSLG